MELFENNYFVFIDFKTVVKFNNNFNFLLKSNIEKKPHP